MAKPRALEGDKIRSSPKLMLARVSPTDASGSPKKGQVSIMGGILRFIIKDEFWGLILLALGMHVGEWLNYLGFRAEAEVA